MVRQRSLVRSLPVFLHFDNICLSFESILFWRIVSNACNSMPWVVGLLESILKPILHYALGLRFVSKNVSKNARKTQLARVFTQRVV